MGILDRMRKQYAVYWGPPVEDGAGGHTYPAPVELRVRWENVDGEVVDPRTHETTNNSSVYVGTDVAINGYMRLCRLADVDITASPENIEGAHRITGFSKIPNLRASDFLRMAVV
jgi:hypothetical protein